MCTQARRGAAVRIGHLGLDQVRNSEGVACTVCAFAGMMKCQEDRDMCELRGHTFNKACDPMVIVGRGHPYTYNVMRRSFRTFRTTEQKNGDGPWVPISAANHDLSSGNKSSAQQRPE